MCCGYALWQPAEDEIRAWWAAGFILEEATADELSEECGTWRVVMRDPAGFSFAFRAGEGVLRGIFGRKLAGGRHAAAASATEGPGSTATG
jgi:hypothetical protein